MCDKINNICHVLDYLSKTFKYVVRSIIATELLAFVDVFDTAMILAHDIWEILVLDIPVYISTDFRQFFDASFKGKRTNEKHLIIDVGSTRQAYKNFEIDRIGLVIRAENPAFVTTKLATNGALQRITESGNDHTPVAQFIERETLQLGR